MIVVDGDSVGECKWSVLLGIGQKHCKKQIINRW